MNPLPPGYRMVRSTRYAVNRRGTEAYKLTSDGWRPVDLEQDPILARALPLLAERAWPVRVDRRGLVPPGCPPGSRAVPGAEGLWVTRRGLVYRYARGADGVRYGSKARVRRSRGRLVVRLRGGHELDLAEVQRAAWPDG